MQDGKVVEEGSYQQLTGSDGKLSTMLTSYKEEQIS